MENLDDRGQSGNESGAKATGGVDAGAIDETQSIQSGQEDNAGGNQDLLDIDPQSLSPELREQHQNMLRDYHAKTQKLSEDRKIMEARGERDAKDAGTMAELSKQEWFKQAISNERARREGRSVDQTQALDADTHRAMVEDPRAFEDYIDRRFERMTQQYRSELGRKTSEIGDLKADLSLSLVQGRLGKPFQDAYEKGLLDKYINEGLSHENAFKSYVFDNGGNGGSSQQVRDEAEKLIARKKNGSLGKNGAPRVKGSRVVKAETFDEAFDAAWKAASKNETIQLERTA